MALTITQPKRNSVSGSKVSVYLSVTFDSSYAPGGEAFDATAYGVADIDSLTIHNTTADELGYVVKYDATNNKLLAYATHTMDDQSSVIGAGETEPLADAKAATDLSALKVDITITGSRA
jgi:hypothetical protein